LPDVCRKIKKANDFFHGVGIQTTASITASRLIEDFDKLPAFLETLGFKSCTFSYPLTSLASSYLSFSDSGLVNFSKDELIELFEKIKRMKERSHFPVVNPTESLTEMQRHLRKEPEKFGCLGGHKYFYLDWKLDLYRCHFWETPMCNVYEWDDSKLIRDGCTRCMIDCYRDPSVLSAWPSTPVTRGRPRRRVTCSPPWLRFRFPQPHFAQSRLGGSEKWIGGCENRPTIIPNRNHSCSRGVTLTVCLVVHCFFAPDLSGSRHPACAGRQVDFAKP
jgi:hypothetical protein